MITYLDFSFNLYEENKQISKQEIKIKPETCVWTQTHRQAVVGEERGHSLTSFNWVRFGFCSGEQRVQTWNFRVRWVRLTPRTDIQILGLERRESPKAISHLEGGGAYKNRKYANKQNYKIITKRQK